MHEEKEMTTTKPQSTTKEPTNASGKPLFPETLTMVACDQCDEAQPWPLRCGHTYIGIYSREYTRVSPASAAPVVDDYEQSGEIIPEEEIQAAIAASKERLHWPFTAKHDNCAECDKEYEAPPAAATAAPQVSDEHDSCSHWREGDSDNCVLCGDDLGPTGDTDVNEGAR